MRNNSTASFLLLKEHHIVLSTLHTSCETKQREQLQGEMLALNDEERYTLHNDGAVTVGMH